MQQTPNPDAHVPICVPCNRTQSFKEKQTPVICPFGEAHGILRNRTIVNTDRSVKIKLRTLSMLMKNISNCILIEK